MAFVSASKPVPAINPKRCRFATFTKEELEAKKENVIPISTRKANIKAAKALDSYLQEIGDKPLKQLTASELARVLGDYYFSARTVDGRQYKCASLENFRHSLNRYLKQHVDPDMDIIKDGTFRVANQSFKAAMAELKQKGLGSVTHYPDIEKSDLSKLYSSPHLSTSNPSGLYNKVQFDIRYYFCRRGGENMVNMTKDSFCIKTDADTGLKYVVKAKDELTKNHRENDNESFSGFMPESSGNPRCPVNSFVKYISKLHPDQDRLWQRPRLHVQEDDAVWYCNQPVGAKGLSKFMKDLSKACDLSQLYTNHCCRSSGTSILTKCGFADAQVMSVTGHKSVQSLTQYQHVGAGEKIRMGSALANALEPNKMAIGAPPCPAPGPIPSRQTAITAAGDGREVTTIDFQFSSTQIEELFSSFANAGNGNAPPMPVITPTTWQPTMTPPTMNFSNCNVNIYTK